MRFFWCKSLSIGMIKELQRATQAADYAIGKSDFREPVWNARAMLRTAIQSASAQQFCIYLRLQAQYIWTISGQYLDRSG